MESIPFLNTCELKVIEIVQPIEVAYACRFYAKVKLGDILELNGSGLTQEHFNYATRAHFDFVVVQNNKVCFAIELDGPGHYSDDTASAANRDKKKNHVCKHFGFELIRIDLGYLNEIGDSHALPILLQNHLRSSEAGPGFSQKSKNDKSKFSCRETDSAADQNLLKQGALISESFSDYNTKLSTIETKDDKFVYVAKMLQVDENRYCVGQSSAHSSKVFGTNDKELASALAAIELDKKVSQYNLGQQPGMSLQEVELLRALYEQPKHSHEIREQVLSHIENGALAAHIQAPCPSLTPFMCYPNRRNNARIAYNLG